MARPVVRGTFSPAGPRRPAVVARLPPTLGIAWKQLSIASSRLGQVAIASVNYLWRLARSLCNTLTPPKMRPPAVALRASCCHGTRCGLRAPPRLRLQPWWRAAQQPNPASRLSRGALPNPSVNRSANGMPPWPRGATSFIMRRAARASFRRRPVTSNVRHRKASVAILQQSQRLAA